MLKLLALLCSLMTVTCGLVAYDDLRTRIRLKQLTDSYSAALAALGSRPPCAPAEPPCINAKDARLLEKPPGAARDSLERPSEGPLIDAERDFIAQRSRLRILRLYGPLLRQLDLPPAEASAMLDLLSATFMSPDAKQRADGEKVIAARLTAEQLQAYREYRPTLSARQSLDPIDYDLQSLGAPLTSTTQAAQLIIDRHRAHCC